MTKKAEDAPRRERLKELIADFKREQTIQDVGLFLVNYPAYRLPPRLATVLSEWLEETSDLRLNYSHAGHPKTDLADYFPLLDQMRATGLSVERTCNMIIDELELHDEVKTDTLAKRYREHRTPESRFIDDMTFGAARADKPGGFDYSHFEKAIKRLAPEPFASFLDIRVKQLVETFGYDELKRAVDKFLDKEKEDTPPGK